MNGSWTALGGGIAIFDAALALRGRPTLSADFYSMSHDHPRLVAVCVAALIAHLYGLLPHRIDPLRGAIALPLFCQAQLKAVNDGRRRHGDSG